MKVVRGIRQFVSNLSVSVRVLVVSSRGASQFVSNSCISVRAFVQETKASTDDSIAMLIKADGFVGVVGVVVNERSQNNTELN